MQRLYKS